MALGRAAPEFPSENDFQVAVSDVARAFHSVDPVYSTGYTETLSKNPAEVAKRLQSYIEELTSEAR